MRLLRFICLLEILLCAGACAAFNPFGEVYDPLVPDNPGTLPPGVRDAESWDAAQKFGSKSAEPVPQLTAAQLASLAIVRGDESRGSAFFCKWKGQFFAVTNAHVLSGNTQFRLTDLKGTTYTTGDIFIGRQFDVAIVRIQETPASFLEIMEDPVREASIGDVVVIPGNAKGGDVVTKTVGKVLGVGPELVEVDAKFVPGNSGSPILHEGTGKVLGLATFLTKRAVKLDSDAAGTDSFKGKYRTEMRWFGFRIDTIKEWERVDWPLFSKEGQEMAKISARTGALVDLFSSSASLERSKDPKIQQALDYYNRDARRPGMTAAFYQQRFQSLIRDLRNVAAEDIRRMPQPVYAYHVESLKKQREIREEIINALAELESRVIEARRQN